MLGIGIETSCDETSIAIVEDGKRCLSNVVFSQTEAHAPFLGIVPELASRAHLEKINFVYEEALEEAGVSLEDLDYIAVTVQPGLIGSLMLGASFAKCLAMTKRHLPIVRVDHVEAHIYAPCLEGWIVEYPFIGLLLSGGNSTVYQIDGPGCLTILADTMDDALGEAFDKVATVLGLVYPGGPSVEKKALEHLPSRFIKDNRDFFSEKVNSTSPLFTPLLRKRPNTEMAFSFSGIKTGVIQICQKKQISPPPIEQICYEFQETVFELVERNLIKAVKKTGIHRIVAGGGVLANNRLRQRLRLLAINKGWELRYPEKKAYCTDNAAMVASLGYFLRHSSWETNALTFTVDSKRSGPDIY